MDLPNIYWVDAIEDDFRIEYTKYRKAFTAVKYYRVAPLEVAEDRRLIFWFSNESDQAERILTEEAENNQPNEHTQEV